MATAAAAAATLLTHGLTSVAFVNRSTGEVVQLTKLTDESVARLGNADSDQTSPTGGRYFAGGLSELDIKSLDLSAHDALHAWMAAGALVSAVGIGPTGVLQWYEQDLITVSRDEIKGKTGGRVQLTVTMRREGHGAHQITFGQNLLAFLGWRETTADVPNGYELTGGTAEASDVGGRLEVEIENAQGVIPSLGTTVLWPLSGTQVTLSVDLVSEHDDGAGEATRMTFKAFDGSTIGSSQAAIAAGRTPNNSVAPAAVYEIAVEIYRTLGNPAAGASVIREPALRIDGSTAYTAY